MCCTRLAENTGRKNYAKVAICAPSHNFVGLFATQAYIDKRKKLLNSDISSTCPHSMVNFCPLTAEIGWWVWGTPANFNGFPILASLLHRRRWTEDSQTLNDVWPSPGLVHSIYIFGGSCPLTEFCQVQNSLCVQVLAFSYVGSVTARHSSSGRDTNCGVQQRAPPIFGRAAITLGIGPHSSTLYYGISTASVTSQLVYHNVIYTVSQKTSHLWLTITLTHMNGF